MSKIWRCIKETNGNYWVSDEGDVISVGRWVRSKNNSKMFKKGKTIKPSFDHNGYLKVVITINGKRKNRSVHRLVAEAFIPNFDNLPQVNHKNEIRTDNRVENLEWCDAKYNNNYGTHNEKCAKARVNHPKLSIRIAQYTLDGKFVAEYPSAIEAHRQLGFSFANIRNCCVGKYKQANGYIWKAIAA